jgi:hypothetical protein
MAVMSRPAATLLLIVNWVWLIAGALLASTLLPPWRWPATLAVVVSGVWFWYRLERPLELANERRAKGLCPGCGYDLTGNVSGVCPECGGHDTGSEVRS